MEPNENKIPDPFQAPDGYFDNFEARLAERMKQGLPKDISQKDVPQKDIPLQVTYKKRFAVEWVAVAAAIAALLVSAWFVLKPFGTNDTTTPIVKIVIPDTAQKTLVVENLDSAIIEKNEQAIVESLLEETEQVAVVTAVNTEIAGADMAIAQELEEDGLIVLDNTDGLFDAIEIMP